MLTINFGDVRLSYTAKAAVLDEMNIGITDVINEYSKIVKIMFITNLKYLKALDKRVEVIQIKEEKDMTQTEIRGYCWTKIGLVIQREGVLA